MGARANSTPCYVAAVYPPDPQQAWATLSWLRAVLCTSESAYPAHRSQACPRIEPSMRSASRQDGCSRVSTFGCVAARGAALAFAICLIPQGRRRRPWRRVGSAATHTAVGFRLVDEALAAGARLCAICPILGLSIRTVQRWRCTGGGADGRHGPNTVPKNKLSEAERKKVVDIANSPEFRDLSPKQIVPALADRGEY